LHRDALRAGISMSDASPYNIQFVGPKPFLIDYLSFRRYQDGEFWAGHRQFCEQFLHPLLLTAYTGVPFHAILRGRLGGIPGTELAALLPFLRRIAPRFLLHVWLPSRFARPKSATRARSLAQRKLPKTALEGLLDAMQSWVSALHPPRGRTAWQAYAAVNSYSLQERGEKAEFVESFVKAARPRRVWDLGCNTGDYACAALRAGAETVVGFDADEGALEAAFQRAERENLRLLPLYQDLLNPSPNQGWRERERRGLGDRTGPDAVLMLALIHHLAIANNVPLDDVVDWVTSLAPAGVIEFVPKDDPMAFLGALQRRASISATREVTGSGRLLVAFQRR
jgi:ribosomal protein L11 methylase PrmA